MSGELVNGTYRVLGELRDSIRPGLSLGQSLVTGELVLIGLPREGHGAHGATAESLRQEGSVFGEVASAHVHSIIDWNPDDVFIAWEYVAAWPLSAVLRTRDRPDAAAVLTMMQAIAQALGAVHARGALYRGLHPGRILVLRDGSARLATTPEAVLTARGRVVETEPPADTAVQYLAPEEIQGVIDVRSDIYSLAAISYELLTGRQVRPNVDPMPRAVGAVTSAFPPPSVLRPEIPGAVDELFGLCLAHDPDERPANIPALLTHIATLLDGVVAPDTQPVAISLSSQPVMFPLLAEDALEGEIYDSLALEAADVAAQDDEADQVEPSRTRRGDKTDVIGPRREAVLVAPDGVTFALEGKRVVVGRRDQSGYAPDVDLEVADTDKVVSRRHAVLDFAEGGWYVSDLKGRNGTWLNGERVRKGAFLRLRPGDSLKIANIMMYYRIKEAETAAPMAVGAGV